VRPLFPFLEPAMVQLSASLRWDQKVRDGTTKAPLKALLAQQVPHEMVYRKKSGFIPPFEAMLTTRSMYAYLQDVVLSKHNPVAQCVDTRVVQRMIERAYQKHPLNLEAYFFLWSVVFGSAWLHKLMKA
jgi:asparagine synthase (glutamine-hydrolysing)